MKLPSGSPVTRVLRCLGLLALCVCAVPAAAAPLPIEHYTRPVAMESVEMSPSGKRLAVLVYGSGGRRVLGVMDLDPVGQPRVVAAFGDADVTRAHWVSDDRLVYEAFQRGAVVRDGGAGTFAVNHDGTGQRQLISWQRFSGNIPGTLIASKVLPYGWFLHSTLDDGSGDVLVTRVVDDHRGDAKEVQLARVNTITGALRNLSEGMPAGTREWLLDAGREPRLLTAEREGRSHVYWRAKASEPWAELANFASLGEDGFQPWAVDLNGDVLVTARQGGQAQALYKLDPTTGRVEPQPVLAIAGYDLDPQPEVDSQTGRLVGLHFVADRPMSHWFDAGLQRIQKSVDAALPEGRSNRLYCGRCESSRFIVIRSGSDRHPGEFFLYDRNKPSLQQIGAVRPWIDEATQGQRSLHPVTTRDGLRMPVYVTHPVGSTRQQPLPTVVLVHGGPWVRGSDLGWSAQAQFLASRGYRVLEPEFRGSAGYGGALFKAGWKQWGRAMQDDLVDAVRWGAETRLVDAGKVCIVGSSYGGYAALMAPIATPGVFRCAASFAGVTDITLMYDVAWSDLTEANRLYSMPVLIGDRDKDAAALAAASPVKRAAEIKIPVFLAHGGEDRRVPIEHARRFRDAARSAGVSVESVEYLHEGHGFFDSANRLDHHGRLARFLEQALLATEPAR